MTIAKFLDKKPLVSPQAFVAPGARLVGAVEVGERASIWFNAVLRADINTIKIGAYSNIQDGTVIHVAGELPVVVGDYVTVGHLAHIHACAVGDRVLIGSGAVILDGAVIGDEAQVAAGALVPPQTQVPPRALVMGLPAKVVRQLSPQEIEANVHWAHKYAALCAEYIARRGNLE